MAPRKKPASETPSGKEQKTQSAEQMIGVSQVEGADKLSSLRAKRAEAEAALNPATRYRPIDFIRAAFSNAKRPIRIPEWAHPETGEPLVLYFEPLTLSDLEWVAMGAPENETLHARNVRLLVHKAKVADGEGGYKPAFVSGDAALLMREAYYSVVQSVTAFMYEVNVTPSEAEKELDDPQTDGSASFSTM